VAPLERTLFTSSVYLNARFDPIIVHLDDYVTVADIQMVYREVTSFTCLYVRSLSSAQ